jgi:uncharacterized protein (TIGR02231 family)
MSLSKRLKQAADCWLNNPRVPREASGTSGMTAAMNGAVNFSTDDGWIPEFVNHGNNGFVVPKADYANMHVEQQDDYDLNKLYEILNKEILPPTTIIMIPGGRSPRTGCGMSATSSMRAGWRMNITSSTDYWQVETVSPLIKKLHDSIAVIKKELGRLEVLSKSVTDGLDLLNANKSIGSTTGVTVADLAKMMDYYQQKTIALRTELSGYNDRSQQLKQQADQLNSDIGEEEKKNSKPGGSLVLQLLSPLAGTCDFTISYLTTAAHWDPSYDLKVMNSTEPLHLLYKARLAQTSGIDWKQVKLSLSTSKPSEGGNAPVLKTKFLRFVDPTAMGYLEDKRLVLRGTSSLNEVVVTSLGTAKDREFKAAPAYKDELGDYVGVSDQQMDVVFNIAIPYDVPGNGKEEGVVLQEYKMPCSYQYFAAPGQDGDAWLLGQMPDWQKLNLLPGEANVMVEGTYIGKSDIDPGSTRDTLNLTLGRDKRIVIKKEKIVDYSSIKFLGSNKKQFFTYEVTVRNNKKEKIRLLLKDQYPISSDKDIEEELLDSGGAVVDKETGILTWNLELAPGESRHFRISYSVKYPKDKTLNIN